jgi:hypothetical protein
MWQPMPALEPVITSRDKGAERNKPHIFFSFYKNHPCHKLIQLIYVCAGIFVNFAPQQ